MKQLIVLISLVLLSFVALSQCEDGRYHDMIFEESELAADILYGGNVNYLGEDQELFLDVYTPSGDTETMRPLVIFAHGGSFIGGSKDGTDVVPLCNDFARMGYTAASVQYRLGIPLTLALQLPATEAVVRGYHDMKAAVRFFRKSVVEGGNPYGINPDEIYLAGVSAGGFITLHVAYLDEENEFPEILDLTLPGMTGGLEGDSGNSGYSSEVNAIVNICGALGDSAWIQPADEPVLSFHGPFDTTVPYGSDVLELLTFPVLEVDGSESVHIKAEEVGLTNCFEIYEGQGHVPHVSNAQYYDTTRAIMSNFLSSFVCPDIDLDCSYTELFDVGIKEVTVNKTFLIFPNPATSQVFMVLPESSVNSELVIIDQAGREVLIENVSPMSSTLEMDISMLESGYYMCRWTDGQLVKNSKLVVTR